MADLQFADCSPKKLADLRFAVLSKEICGFEIFELTYLRNLRIFDCKMSPRICGLEILKKHLHAHLCKFANVVNHTGGKFVTGVNDTGSILPPVSTAPVVNLPPVSKAPVVHLEL